MKKNLIVCFILLAALTTCIKSYAELSRYALESEMLQMKPVLSKKLHSCTPYIYNGDTFVASIMGIKNKKCIYKFYSTETDVDCMIRVDYLKKYSEINPSTVCTAAKSEDNSKTADFSINFLFK